ncbi:MAG: hypothetical protein E4G96_02910 [Chrysiogenales bacterium]|nr:MAG: hypothetical protein E4G96_02910 [Chrysiogenales bacterium]
MKTFEGVMGFLLLFTAIYLIGLFDGEVVLPMITFLGFIALGVWQYGIYGTLQCSRISRVASALILVVIVLSGYFVTFHFLYADKGISEKEVKDFTVARLLENRDAGRISVVNFTAEWCPNCKLVENMTLRNEEVAGALGANHIEYMVADITISNPAAEKLMSLFRSRSIPLLAVVPPGKGFRRPIILRDIFTRQDLLKALESATDEIEK